MRIIFLDIDGVLNSRHFFQTRDPRSRAIEWSPEQEDQRWLRDLDPVAADRLNEITDATGATLVISSTWRLVCQPLDRLARVLSLAGVTGEVVGQTPRLPQFDNAVDVQRGMEIADWLSTCELDVTSFIILDDDADMAHLMDRLVKTTFDEGLQDEHVAAAIALLEGSE